MIRQNTNSTKITIGLRLAAMLLDHFLMGFVMMIFYIPFLFRMFQGFDQPKNFENFNLISSNEGYIALFGFSLYFCKDCISGRSIAKRIISLQLVDNKTGAIANPFRCLVRNLLCIIWPIEVIVTISNPNRRIGDFIAGTKLEPYNPALKQRNPNYFQIGISLVLAYAITLFFSYSLQQCIP